MRVLGGRLFDGQELFSGTVEVDRDGYLLEVQEGDDTSPPEVSGVVVPAPVNAHTHLADRQARGRFEPTSIEEVVAPPDGLKHRLLASMDPEETSAAIAASLDEADRSGTGRVLDFREGGPVGARAARRAARRAAEASGVHLVVLGRPSSPEAWEAEAPALRELVDGIGVSGLNDQPYEVSLDQAAWCREHDRRLGLHVSEPRREDIEAALALEPDLLVHATHADPEDIGAIAEAGVPVVLCPRANALFGNSPPVVELIDAGVPLGLGSDNAMFHPVDVWAEAASLLDRFPSVEPVHVLAMACGFRLPGEPAPGLTPGTRVCVLDDTKGLRQAVTHSRVAVPWRDEPAR